MFHVYLYCTIMSVPCSLVITCWEKADLLAILYVMLPCVFVTFSYDVSGQARYLIVSIPDLCFLLYLNCFPVVIHCISLETLKRAELILFFTTAESIDQMVGA